MENTLTEKEFKLSCQQISFSKVKLDKKSPKSKKV